MSGQNIGDLLNAAGITWGFFEGGFDLTAHESQRHHRLHPLAHLHGHRSQRRTTTSRTTSPSSTTLRPRTRSTCGRPRVQTIGADGDQATTSTTSTTSSPRSSAGNFPAVSFLKAPGYQDGHAGYSDPLDEQTFVVHVINFLQQTPDWEQPRSSSPMTTPTAGTTIR